jgi:hypothetical protein
MAAIFAAGATGKCPITITLPSCLPTLPGLVGWWGGEYNADDAIGPNHGMTMGDVEYGTGRVGNGFVIGGRNGGVSLATSAGLRHQDFTIEAWIRRASSAFVSHDASGFGEIISVGSTAGGYGLRLQKNGRVAFGNGESDDIVAGVGIIDTNWHHIALTKLGSSLTFYLDAVPFPAKTQASGVFQFTDYAFIGARWNRFSRLDRSFFGTIDELSFYNRPLSAAEVLSLYNSGCAGKCRDSSPPVITAHPSHESKIEEDYVKLTVAAAGTPPLGFQWLRDGYPIPGATGTSLTLPNIQLADAGDYAVEVSNLLAAVTSSTAQLQVKPLGDCFAAPAGLVNWWRAEQGTVDSVNELSGQRMNGAGFSAGKVGSAFSFNGENQFVLVPNSETLNPSNAISMECWIYVEQHSIDPLAVVASKDDPVSHTYQYGLGLKNMGFERWHFAIQLRLPTGNALLHGTKPIDLQRWYHVAWTYDQAFIKLYVDGVLDVTVVATGPISPQSHPLVIGGYGTHQWNLNGRVDEISLYQRALSPFEIKSIYLAGSAGKCPLTMSPIPLPDGLVGWWPGETNPVDSAAAQPATQSPGRATFAPGQVGTAFRLSSETLGMVLTNVAASPRAALTLTCWVYSENCPTNLWACIVGRPLPASDSFQYAFECANTGGRSKIRARARLAGGEVLVESATSLDLENWHHLAMTYDGYEIRLYVNGVLEGKNPAGGVLAATDLPLMLGAADVSQARFVGRLDEVALYDRALNSSELAGIFIAGKTGKSRTDAPYTVRDLRKWFFGTKPNTPPVSEN